MSVQKSDYAHPFAVEWSNNPAAEECEDRRFAKLADAWAFIERIEVRYRCIWLSEVGSYTTKKDFSEPIGCTSGGPTPQRRLIGARGRDAGLVTLRTISGLCTITSRSPKLIENR